MFNLRFKTTKTGTGNDFVITDRLTNDGVEFIVNDGVITKHIHVSYINPTDILEYLVASTKFRLSIDLEINDDILLKNRYIVEKNELVYSKPELGTIFQLVWLVFNRRYYNPSNCKVEYSDNDKTIVSHYLTNTDHNTPEELLYAKTIGLYRFGDHFYWED